MGGARWGLAEASGAGGGSGVRAFWCRFSRCFGVGFTLKSQLKMTCGAGKNRAKSGNKKSEKPR